MDSAAALLGWVSLPRGFLELAWASGTSSAKIIEAVSRQPEAGGRVGKYMWIGFAVVEAIVLYGLVIVYIIMGLRK